MSKYVIRKSKIFVYHVIILLQYIDKLFGIKYVTKEQKDIDFRSS
jgi:hypothetical protein